MAVITTANLFSIVLVVHEQQITLIAIQSESDSSKFISSTNQFVNGVGGSWWRSADKS
jgi:hypothetical protein